MRNIKARLAKLEANRPGERVDWANNLSHTIHLIYGEGPEPEAITTPQAARDFRAELSATLDRVYG